MKKGMNGVIAGLLLSITIGLSCSQREFNNPMDPSYHGNYLFKMSWNTLPTTLKVFSGYTVVYKSGTDKYDSILVDQTVAQYIDTALFRTNKTDTSLYLYFIKPYSGIAAIRAVRPNLQSTTTDTATISVINPFTIELARNLDTIGHTNSAWVKVGDTSVIKTSADSIAWIINSQAVGRLSKNVPLSFVVGKSNSQSIGATVKDKYNHELYVDTKYLTVRTFVPVVEAAQNVNMSIGSNLLSVSASDTDGTVDSVFATGTDKSLAGYGYLGSSRGNINIVITYSGAGIDTLLVYGKDNLGMMSKVDTVFVSVVGTKPQLKVTCSQSIKIGTKPTISAIVVDSSNTPVLFKVIASSGWVDSTVLDSGKVARKDTIAIDLKKGVTDVGNITLKFVIIDGLGLVSDTVVKSLGITYDIPVVTFKTRSIEAIAGDEVQLKTTVTPAGSVARYVWTVGNRQDTTSVDSFKVTVSSSSKVFVYGISEFGIVGSPDTATITIKGFSYRVTAIEYPTEIIPAKWERFIVSAKTTAGAIITNPVTYSWSISPLNSPDSIRMNKDTLMMKCAGNGTYQIGVRVKGIANDSSAWYSQVVNASFPVPTCRFLTKTVLLDSIANVLLKVTATDTKVAIDSILWDRDGNGSANTATKDTSLTLRFNTTGSFSVIARAKDVLGYVSAPDTARITLVIRKPYFNAIPDAECFKNDSVTLRVSANKANAATPIVRYFWDLNANGSWDVITDSATIKTKFIAVGRQKVIVQCEDQNSKTAKDSFYVTVRLGKPVLMAFKADSVFYRSAVRCTASVFDTNGIVRKIVVKTGTVIDTFYNADTNAIGVQKITWLDTFNTPGNHAISLFVIDNDGNKSDSAAFSVFSKTGKPVITGVTVDSGFAPKTITCSAMVYDTNGYISKVIFNWGDGEVVVLDSMNHANPKTVISSKVFTSQSNIGITIKAIDNYGDTSTIASCSTKVLRLAPVVTINMIDTAYTDTFVVCSVTAVTADDGYPAFVNFIWPDTLITVSGSGTSKTQSFVSSRRYAVKGSKVVKVIAHGSNGIYSDTATKAYYAYEPVRITVQPISAKSISVDSSYTFSITATGSFVLFQWKKNNNVIPGATASTYTLQNITNTNTGSYTCVVSNRGGNITSTATELTVITPASITTQPTASQAITVGASTTLSVVAAGNPLAYQWKLDGNIITGETGSSYTILTAITSQAGTYTCVVSNLVSSVETNPAAVRVLYPVGITSQTAATQTIVVGNNATFSIVANGTNPLYQWKKNGVNIAGKTSATLTINNVTFADTGVYSCYVYNEASYTSSTNGILFIVNPIVISANPQSTTALVGAVQTFTVGVYGTSPQFQWKKNNVNMIGKTSATLTISNVQPTDAATYTCYVSNDGSNATTNNIVLTVVYPIAITTQPQSQSLAVGASASISIVASGTNPQYQWWKDGVAIGGATSATYSIATVSNTNAGSYFCYISNAGSEINSNTVTVTVMDGISITTQPTATQAIQVGSSATFTVAAIGTSPQYQWKFNGSNINSANSASYTVSNATLGNSGSYTCYVSNAASNQTSSAGVLTVQTPVAITVQPTVSQQLLVGGSASLSVTATGTSVSYQWRKNGVDIGGQTGSSMTISSAIVSDSAVYTCYVHNGISNVTSSNATLAVFSVVTITTQPVAKNVGNDSSATLSCQATGNGISYQWYKNGIIVGGATSNSYTSAIAKNDTGNYYCYISNAMSNAQTNTVKLSSQASVRPDGWTESQCDTVQLHVGNQYGIPCRVYADAGMPVTTQFYVGGVLLQTWDISNANGGTWVLYANNVQLNQTGIVRVVVFNSVSSITKRQYLRVVP